MELIKCDGAHLAAVTALYRREVRRKRHEISLEQKKKR